MFLKLYNTCFVDIICKITKKRLEVEYYIKQHIKRSWAVNLPGPGAAQVFELQSILMA